MSLQNTAAEILKVRQMLGDAAELLAVTLESELRTSASTTIVYTRYGQIMNVHGVWLATDPDHVGTEYYGAGSFNAYTREITLETSLPATNTDVLINYTYHKGLPDGVIDVQITFAKAYISSYTNFSFDWTAASPDVETTVAISAMTYRAAQGCLIYQFAPDVLQKGFNFRIEEFSIESKTWAGGMGIGDLLELWTKHLNDHLAVLGEYGYYSAPSTTSYGRTVHGYKMDNKGDVS
jgi:hypothetical protein